MPRPAPSNTILPSGLSSGPRACVPKTPTPNPELCRGSPSPEPGAWTQQVLSQCLRSKERLNPSSQPPNEELGESTPSKARTSLCHSEQGQLPSCPGQRPLVAGDLSVAEKANECRAWDSRGLTPGSIQCSEGPCFTTSTSSTFILQSKPSVPLHLSPGSLRWSAPWAPCLHFPCSPFP